MIEKSAIKQRPPAEDSSASREEVSKISGELRIHFGPDNEELQASFKSTLDSDIATKTSIKLAVSHSGVSGFVNVQGHITELSSVDGHNEFDLTVTIDEFSGQTYSGFYNAANRDGCLYPR